MKYHFFTLVIATIMLNACVTVSKNQSQKDVNFSSNVIKNSVVFSKSRNNSIEFFLNDEKIPTYSVYHNKKMIIKPSSMHFEFTNAPEIGKNMEWLDTKNEIVKEEYELPWGEQRMVKNQYEQVIYYLRETEAPFRKWNIHFRIYDDGVTFRHEFPEQDNWKEALIKEERSEFNLTEDAMTWWIPGDWDIYEHLYNTTKISEIDAISKRKNKNLAQTEIPVNAVNTPVTMRYADGTHLSFHEAALMDYSDMTLQIGADSQLFSNLVGSDNTPYKVKRQLPFQTPWRSIMIGDEAKDLIQSNLILNLNEPNVLGEIPFKPMKYVGIWWEMHIGKSTWDYAGTQDAGNANLRDLKPTGKHGATTENTKKYIDFAAQHGFGGVLVEGWNTGWEHWIGFEDREGVFDFVTPYPDYDLKGLSEYAKEKGVEIIMHHETSAATETYIRQLHPAFQLMKAHGMGSVKTGYVGTILPKGEYHHGQYMVNHYQQVLETAAQYGIAVNAHEPIKPTGLRRTYPNFIAREGLRGQEFNAWANDGGNPPEHLPIVAFTRMLAGPIDFTPGAFDLEIPSKPQNQINTTLAQQLALYVVIYSPLQMACDLPENYEANPKPFQFIKDVGVDWEQTKVLDGEVGDYVVIARQERETMNWFVGGITDENPRDFKLIFDFLDAGKTYKAKIYKDGKEAHYKNNPTAIEIEEFDIQKGYVLNIHMAAGGGFAISLHH